MKNFNVSTQKSLAFVLLLSFMGLFSCSKDEMPENTGRLSVSAKSTFTSASGKSTTSKTVNSDVVVTDFRMNLKEFELELDLEDSGDDLEGSDDDLWDDDGYYDFEDEIELAGPFELDLMAGQISFINVTMPMGNFEELEFKFDESTDATSDLFGKSVLIQGTVQDTPFIFWHNFEDEVEVDFEDPTFDIAISSTPGGIVIDFDLSLIFDGTAGVDLSQATDGNGDGTIEISPSDPDGNNDLAQSIRNAIKAHIDLLDD
ncbi:MAG: hypothetical protein VX798_07635 [Bacteroidota bacterium]|uniref:DUF4382 domain-containing protein n=1 Tax=Flagellimonas profundi TaxID=2915620 RepID=A0ABS3FDA9_9FLAO|nr:hypothetical protein [Allomuricauda profundi]MBO0341154.1 hypothetical protein [Allomuricauda profundi]MEC7771038.1 hypothetical protein [Bacteroidota bacterium]